MRKVAATLAFGMLVGGACGGRRAPTIPGGDTTEIARALVGPYLSPEFGMDNPTSGPSQQSSSTASAFDGNGFFAVWQDRRQGTAHIYGTRVSAAGAVLDRAGILIGTTTSGQGAPAIAFGGGQFLVAWEQTPSLSSTPKIYVSRVSVDGVVLDPAGVAVSSNTGNRELAPAIAFDGTNFLVVWGVGIGSNGRIAAARISQAGKLVDTTSIVVSSISTTATETQSQPAIIFDGTNYLIAWQDARSTPWDIYANRVSPAGTVLDGNGFLVANVSNQELQPAVAFGGGNALVVWNEYPADGSRDTLILGRRVSPAGAVLDTSALVLSNAVGEQRDPAATFDGTNYLVTWGDQRVTNTSKLFATRVAPDGTVLDPTGVALIATPASQNTPALSVGGGQTLLTWTDSTVRAARLDLSPASKDGGGFPLSAAPNTQVDPEAAFDGTNYLVVWTDSRQGTPSIFGTRVSRQGAVLDVAGIKISSGDVPQTASSIAWNGSSYLVTWGGTRAGARRVGANGNVLDAADIDLPGISMYDVASNGVDFLVVGTPTGGSNAIAGIRVSGAGAVLDATPIAISPVATGSRYTPRPAFDGTNYWVVWLDYRTGTSVPFGARVTPAGQVLDPNGIQLTEPTGTEYHGNPDVASDGAGTSFAVWEDSRGYAIRGTRLTAAGQVLDPAGAMVLPTPSAYDLLSVPVVAFDGTNYVLGAVDHRNNSSFSTISYDLMANRFTPAGASLGGLQVASQPTATVPGTVASDRMGGSIFMYVLPDTSSGFPVSRVRARIFTEDAPVNGCTSSVGCPSGFCVDGVCCATACGGGATDCVACSVTAGAAADGTCGPVVNGRACNDNNACTTGDTCMAGVCMGTASPSCTPDGGTDARADSGSDGAAGTSGTAGTGGRGGTSGAGGSSGAGGTSGTAGAGGRGGGGAAGTSGAAGTGGTAGTGGATGTGGGAGTAAGSAGTSGVAGAPGGTGGSGAAGNGGSSGSAGSGGTNTGSSGCSCDVGSAGGPAAPLALLAGAALRRRRVRACRR